MRQCRAAVLVELNRPLRIADLDIPDLKAGQVLVKFAYSGICGTQLLEIQGRKGEDRFLPHTLGHEGSGVVVAIGSGVKKAGPGDHVIVSWIKGVGADVPSSSYHSSGGIVNSGAVSAFSTHAIVSENRVVRISKDMPLREAALLGCAVPTGAGTVLRDARVQRGQSVAVFG